MKNLWKDSELFEVLEDSNEMTKKTKFISSEIICKNITLVEFVDSLGPALISTDTSLRAKGTEMLSITLSTLPDDFLNDTEFNFIVDFYCNRLKDHHSVLPGVITGILALAQMKNKVEGNCTKILQAMFLNVPCQSQLREDRGNIFTIIKLMAEHHPNELLAMGPDFVLGVIQSLDGERDPRNLMFLFTYMPEFVKKFPLGHLSDDMFEVFECYFPIDFHPTKNDPTTITRELLANELCNCLCSSLDFTEKCLELALEKIDSELIIAKIDSLNLLTKSSESFKIEIIEKHFDTIWPAIRNEILPGTTTTKEITVAALKTMESIIAATANNQQICENILNTIFNSITTHISDINARLFTQSINILLVCASSSNQYATIFVANKFLSVLLSQIDLCENINVNQKSTLMEIITKILVKCLEKNVIDKIDNQMLNDIQKQLINSLESEEFIQISFDCLTKLARIVIIDNRLIIYNKLKLILQSTNIKINIKECFLTFSSIYPEEMMNNVVMNLLNDDGASYVFEILCSLVHIQYFNKIIIEFIFKQIFDTKNEQIRLIMLKNFQLLLKSGVTKEFLNDIYINYKIFEKFLYLVHHQTLTDDGLLQISNICNLIVKSLTIEQQNNIIKTYLKSMNLNLIEDLYMTSGLLGFIEPDVCLTDHFEIIIDELTRVALAFPNDVKIKKICNYLLCSLFNKMPDNENNRNILKKIVQLLTKEIEKHNKQAIEILSWISKGLLVRGHTDAADLIDTLISLLEHPSLSTIAVFGFEIICIEFPDLHLPIVKFLFKQKLFQTILTKIIMKFEHFTESHLSAISYVLKMTPHAVLKMNIEKIQKVLFKCLDLTTVNPVLISLEIINRFLIDKDEHFQTHIQYLVPQLIRLSQFKESMNIRIAALNAIASLKNYPTFMLLPIKHEVLLGLEPALDDHKRLVRNSAVNARTIWFLIGHLGEEK